MFRYFWLLFSLFSNPELDFTGVAISFAIAGIVLAFFTYLAEREKKKEQEWQIRHNYFLKKSKRKKEKEENREIFIAHIFCRSSV